MAGIVGVYSQKDAIRKAHYALVETQHLGQQNCGLAAAGNHSLRVYKGKRLMSNVFFEDAMKAFIHPTDYAAIGHVGDKKVERSDIAPIELEFDDCRMAVSMSGLILNRDHISKEYNLSAGTDEELFGHLFYRNLRENKELEDAARKTMAELDKAYYSLTMLIQKDDRSNLVAMRDRRGVKPMYMGRTERSVFISSESGAVDTLRTIMNTEMEMRDVVPGELIIAGPDGFANKQLMEPRCSHCIFEWVYTARPDAVMEGRTAHEVRKMAGRLNVELHGLKDDGDSVMIGTPDSGRSVALGAAAASSMPFDEGMIKNQYIGRTYIIPDEKERNVAAMLKHNPIKNVIANKRVIIGDDSIVRGTITEALARTLLHVGAKSVDMLISYAPIFYPCFTDPVNKRLACKGMKDLPLEEIERRVAKDLRVINHVYYNSVENVVKAVGLPEEHLCTYCITGKNPFAD